MPKHDSSSEALDHLRVAHRLPEPDRSKTLRPKSPLTDKCLVSCLAGANSAPGRGLNAWADPHVRLLCGQRQVEEPLAASETGYTCPGRGLNARAEPEVRLLCGKCGCANRLPSALAAIVMVVHHPPWQRTQTLGCPGSELYSSRRHCPSRRAFRDRHDLDSYYLSFLTVEEFVNMALSS
jgi:hypothetical protein